MRTLERNKTTFWIVNCIDEVDVKDEDGFYTGEKELGYSSPTLVKLSVYPASGDIVEQIFGKQVVVDLVAVSENVKLDKMTLIFKKEPTLGEYDNYDYKVTHIAESLNHTQYGLRGRF